MDILMYAKNVKIHMINYEIKLTGIHKVFVNPDLAKFTPRQLIEELRGRGYTGELKYVQVIKI